jgi:hypothetical protein
MKSGIRTTLMPITLILGAAVLFVGCKTTGVQRSEKAGASMKTVERDINLAMTQMDATGSSLEELVKPGQSDVKKAFKKYSSNVDKMERQGKRLFEHADKMSAQGKEYFEEWRIQGNTYTNPQIQALSEQRRADLNAVFAGIPESSVGVKGAFKAYMTDIREVRTYLTTDLTPKGIESIAPTAQKAVSDGVDLKDAIKPVLSAIETARDEIAQGGAKE